MNRKKSIFVLSAGIGIIIILCIFIGGIIRINQRYESPALNAWGKNTYAAFYDDIEIMAVGTELWDDARLRALPDIPDSFLTEEPTALIPVTIRIKNTGTEVQYADLTVCVLESLGWSNGVNLEFYLYLNPEITTLYLELMPGEELTLILPYSMIESHFNKKEWPLISEREFYLTYRLYPEKDILLL